MNIQHCISLNKTTGSENVPSLSQFTDWCYAALTDCKQPVEINIRIVDADEMTQLNQTYRHKQGSTNILSFSFSDMPTIDTNVTLLGDLVICAPIVIKEAKQQGKTIDDHWAHLTIHGTLHLRGYDHEQPQQAFEMETLEIAILAKLGIENPYEPSDNS